MPVPNENGHAGGGLPRQNLRTPGPTPLPPEVREALGRDMLDHRGPEFAAVFHACIEGLRWVFQTQNDVLILTSSGTGGLESVVVNTLSPGQKVLAVSMGYFGDRFADIARSFGANVVPLSYPWGQAAKPAEIAERLRSDPEIQTVFVTHNETSTGVMNPLPEIARSVREVRPDVLLAVDAISSAASVPILPDAWGCDVVVGGSQKGYMIPPGLTFVYVGPRAWDRQKQAQMPRTYFDWALHKKELARGSTPWTPGVSMIFALQAALGRIQAEGLEQVFARHQRVSIHTRQRLADMGMRPFADPAHASWTVTGVYAPDGVDVKALLAAVREKHNVVLARGQGAYESKMFRVGHVGYVTAADVDTALDALEVELAATGALAGAART